MRNTKLALSALLLCAVMSSRAAFAGGYEKAIMWSGHFAGFGNAATAVVDNSEGLYFNPAGMAGIKSADLSLNFSPTLSQFKGPIVLPGRQETSNLSFTPPLGVTAGAMIMDKLAVGLGAFVSGGTKAVYENVDFSAINGAFTQLKPTVKSDLEITEFSLGAAYELIPGLRVGGAWRIAMVKASLASASATPAIPAALQPALLTEVDINDISATQFNGARLGVQYAPESLPFGLGVTWRSSLHFSAKGTSTGQIVTGLGGAPSTLKGGDATIDSTFPQQLSVGLFVDPRPKKTRFLFQWDWTQYGVDRTLGITGGVTLPTSLASTTIAIPSIDQGWKNQHNFRWGLEHKITDSIPVRAGYVLTTAVVPARAARATFSSPGLGNTLTVGSGFSTMSDSLKINAAFEYSWANGAVGPQDQTLTGEYVSHGYTLHVGAEYSL